jgi:hypothetical protein
MNKGVLLVVLVWAMWGITGKAQGFPQEGKVAIGGEARESLAEQRSRKDFAEFGESGRKGLEILKRGVANYPKHRDCFSCHHQALPLFAIRMGDAVQGQSENRESMDRIEQFSKASLGRDLAAVSDSEDFDGRGLTLGYAMWTMDLGSGEMGSLKQGLLRKGIATQQPGGFWRIHSHRPPASSSDLIATALVVSSLVNHMDDSDLTELDRVAMRESIFRAMVWYVRHEEPKSTEDRCGLLWLGSVLRRFVTSELASNGAWAIGTPGNMNLISALDLDKDLLVESRLEEALVDPNVSRPGGAKTLGDLFGFSDYDWYFNKYAMADTGVIQLGRSDAWRAWLKESYSRQEVVEILRADRKRGLNDMGRRLIEAQNSDGGWGQGAGLESEAYSTGMSLIVLGEVYSERDVGMTSGGVGSQRFVLGGRPRWGAGPVGGVGPGGPPGLGGRVGLGENRPAFVFFRYHLRGLRYLKGAQGVDGSWHVSSRATPVQEYFDNGDPYESDQFISMMGTAWASAALLNAWRGQYSPLSY